MQKGKVTGTEDHNHKSRAKEQEHKIWNKMQKGKIIKTYSGTEEQKHKNRAKEQEHKIWNKMGLM